jgi:hypothetical protein
MADSTTVTAGGSPPALDAPAWLNEDESIAVAAEEPLGALNLEPLSGGADTNLGTGLVTLAASEEEQNQDYVPASPPPPPEPAPPLSEDEVLLSGTGLDALCDTVVLSAVQEAPSGETERDRHLRLQREREQARLMAAMPVARYHPPHPSVHAHVGPGRPDASRPKLAIRIIVVGVVVVLAVAVTALMLLVGK